MKKILNLFISSAKIIITFLIFQTIQSMEEKLNNEEQTGIQQRKVAVDSFKITLYSSNHLWGEMITNLDKVTDAEEEVKKNIENLKDYLEVNQKNLSVSLKYLKAQFEEAKKDSLAKEKILKDLEKSLAESEECNKDLSRQLEINQRELEDYLREQQKTKIYDTKIPERLDRWCSGIDETLEHILTLRRSDITYEELLKVLLALQNYYEGGHYLLMQPTSKYSPTITSLLQYIGIGEIINRVKYAINRDANSGCLRIHEWQSRYDSTGQSIAAKLGGMLWSVESQVRESMEIYKELYGHPHPRWEEFNKR